MTRKLKYGIFALLLGWSCTEIAAQTRLPEVDYKCASIVLDYRLTTTLPHQLHRPCWYKTTEKS